MEKFYPRYLFTYGTLMQNFTNPFAEKLRLTAIFEGAGFFTGKLYRIDWYPGALFEENGKSRVYGEIYKLTSLSVLKELDEYEDVFEDETSSLYLRKVVPVIMENGAQLLCWTYLYNQPIEADKQIITGRFEG